MITSAELFTPTRMTGIAAYAVAMASCAIAWARTRQTPIVAQLAATLAMVEGVLLLDMIFNWRWLLHGQIMNLAEASHEYSIRRPPQLVAIVVLVLLLLFGWRQARRRYSLRPGAFLAVSGVLASLTLWSLEVISLHAVDQVFYHQVGAWLAVSGLWVLACLATSVGAFIDTQQARAKA